MVDDALAQANLDRAEVLSVELVGAKPLQYEPAGAPPPSAPRPLPTRASWSSGDNVKA